MLDLNCWESKFKACYYTNKLLKKILLLNKNTVNKVNIVEVKKAIFYAKKYHGNQKRQTGEPYYSHPIEVAYMAIDYIFRTDIIVISILHDTIEDTLFTKEMISLIFSSEIATQIEHLTKIKEYGKISFMQMVKSLIKQNKYEILLIKLIDRLHNLQTLTVKSPEKQKKIVKESLQIFLMLIVTLELEIAQGITASKCFIKIFIEALNELIKKRNYLTLS